MAIYETKRVTWDMWDLSEIFRYVVFRADRIILGERLTLKTHTHTQTFNSHYFYIMSLYNTQSFKSEVFLGFLQS